MWLNKNTYSLNALWLTYLMFFGLVWLIYTSGSLILTLPKREGSFKTMLYGFGETQDFLWSLGTLLLTQLQKLFLYRQFGLDFPIYHYISRIFLLSKLSVMHLTNFISISQKKDYVKSTFARICMKMDFRKGFLVEIHFTNIDYMWV